MSSITSNEIDNQLASNQKDGLMDIFIGFAIFFAGLFLWADMVWMAGIFAPIFLPSFQAARKRFLERRIGELPHDSHRQAQAQKVLFTITLLLGVLFLAGVGMFYAYDWISGPVNDWLRHNFLLVLGLVFGGVWIFAALMLKTPRFHLYSAFTIAALTAAQFTMLALWLSIVILGGSIILGGTILLIRFVQQHPTMTTP
jgi:hypothetical protein